MALTPEQSQLLQAYMMKNRAQPQAVQAPPVQLPAQTGGGSGGSSLLSTIGGWFDTAPMQGPVQPGQAPLPQGQQSWLSQFADKMDPMAAQQRQQIQQQQPTPQINRDQVAALMKKMGII